MLYPPVPVSKLVLMRIHMLHTTDQTWIIGFLLKYRFAIDQRLSKIMRDEDEMIISETGANLAKAPTEAGLTQW